MPSLYRNIAQLSPTSTANVDLYTCPANTQAVVSTLVVANRATTNQTFCVAIRSGTAAAGAGTANIGSTATPSDSAWIFYETLVYAQSTLAVTMGLTLTQNEVVTVRSSLASTAANSGLSFLLFGSVVT